MTRMKDEDVVHHSSLAATQYLEDNFSHLLTAEDGKKPDLVQKHQVVNCFAHGFAAGIRYREKVPE